MQESLSAGNQRLVQIVDAALADAARKSGDWLVCRPGCTQCCVGVFAINELDALRLRNGLAELTSRDPARAERLLGRVHASRDRLQHDFPGDPATGRLDPGAEEDERFAVFGDDEVCPVLDPETGTCDLYDSRPMTCRVFGPPVRSEDGLGVCELCYHGATEEQIAACEMIADPENLEETLLRDLESATGISGRTTVSFCLAK